MSSSPSVPLALDHILSSPSEQLCYVQCSFCDTVLAVSVPCSSLFKTVAVRCGHCANLLSVNMRGLLGFDQAFLAPTAFQEDVISYPPPLLSVDQINSNIRSPMNSRPPEKRQRVPSAYNRFIKDEIQRIKAGNPDITHREAFSAAAKNWAHFPHIHFATLPDEALKMNNMRQQNEDLGAMRRDDFYAASAIANLSTSPFRCNKDEEE